MVKGEVLCLKDLIDFPQLFATCGFVREQRSDQNAQTEVCMASKGASCF